MLGIVLVAHGPLASSMKQVVESIVGSTPELFAVDVNPKDDPDKVREEIADKVIQANDGAGVVVITDILGGLPSNLAVSLESEDVRVLSGMNVPMIIKLIRCREQKLDEAVQEAAAVGSDFILNSVGDK